MTAYARKTDQSHVCWHVCSLMQRQCALSYKHTPVLVRFFLDSEAEVDFRAWEAHSLQWSCIRKMGTRRPSQDNVLHHALCCSLEPEYLIIWCLCLLLFWQHVWEQEGWRLRRLKMALAVEPSFPWGTWCMTISQTSLHAISRAQWKFFLAAAVPQSAAYREAGVSINSYWLYPNFSEQHIWLFGTFIWKYSVKGTFNCLCFFPLKLVEMVRKPQEQSRMVGESSAITCICLVAFTVPNVASCWFGAGAPCSQQRCWDRSWLPAAPVWELSPCTEPNCSLLVFWGRLVPYPRVMCNSGIHFGDEIKHVLDGVAMISLLSVVIFKLNSCLGAQPGGVIQVAEKEIQ